jgi:ATP-dependent exoDNAse (exonuclease V) alpha subunit
VSNKLQRDEEDDEGKIPLEKLVEKCQVKTINDKAGRNESLEAMDNLWKDVEKDLRKKSWPKKKRKSEPDDDSNVDQEYGVILNLKIVVGFSNFHIKMENLKMLEILLPKILLTNSQKMSSQVKGKLMKELSKLQECFHIGVIIVIELWDKLFVCFHHHHYLNI